MRTLLTAAACIAAMSSTAAASPARPIVHGLDTDGDPAVVALVDTLGLRCTGTLVSPRLIVTAAHCFNGGRWRVVFGARPDAPEHEREAARWVVHPGWDPRLLTYDVALVILAEAAPATIAPVAIASRPPVIGAALRLVGYGKTSVDDQGPPRKREGAATVGDLGPGALTIEPEPAQTCHGDSGGPALALLGGVERLVGVTSHGDSECDDLAVDQRVDSVAADFLAPYLAIDGARDRGPGQTCISDVNCAAGTRCVPDDDWKTWSCGAPCAERADCAGAATACEPDLRGPVCRYDGAARGATCASTPSCTDGLCVDGACAAACPVGTCPEPTPEETGGCSTGGGGLIGWGVIIGAAFPFLRRRRRLSALTVAGA